ALRFEIPTRRRRRAYPAQVGAEAWTCAPALDRKPLPDEFGPFGHCLHFSEGDGARQIFETTIRRHDHALGVDKGQGALDACGDDFGGLDFVRGKIEYTENDGLVRQRLEHSTIEVRLRRLDGYLLNDRVGEFRQEGIAFRPLVDYGRIAEADMHRRRAFDPFEGAIEGRDTIFSRLVGTGL